MIKILAAAVLMTVLTACAAGVTTSGGTTFGVRPAPYVVYDVNVRRPRPIWGGRYPYNRRYHRYGR